MIPNPILKDIFHPWNRELGLISIQSLHQLFFHLEILKQYHHKIHLKYCHLYLKNRAPEDLLWYSI